METVHSDMITVSPSAVKQIQKIKEEGQMGPEYFLRVSVVGGGCSGLSYKLDFDNESYIAENIFLFFFLK